MNNHNIELFKAYKTIRPICHNGIEKNIDLKFSNGFQEKNLHAIIILKTDQWFYYVPLVSYKNDYLEMYEKNSWNNVIINNAISKKNNSNSFSVALVGSINRIREQDFYNNIDYKISDFNKKISEKDQQKILKPIKLNLLEYPPKMVINEIKIDQFNKVEAKLIYGNKNELFQNIKLPKEIERLAWRYKKKIAISSSLENKIMPYLMGYEIGAAINHSDLKNLATSKLFLKNLSSKKLLNITQYSSSTIIEILTKEVKFYTKFKYEMFKLKKQKNILSNNLKLKI